MDLPDVDPKYTSMCGEKTLQEEEKGFFGGLVKAFLDSSEVVDWAQEMWAQRLYGADYINSLVQQNQIITRLLDIFTVQPVYRKKNAETSLKVRKMAGKEMSSGNYQKALAYCNQAVIMSPCVDDDKESMLAMALWLRAECLMKISNFDLALRDLQAAMKANLPVVHRGMLFHRQGECYKKMGEIGRAKISFELAIKMLPENQAFQEKLRAEVINLKSCEEKIAGNSKKKVLKPDNFSYSNSVGVEQRRGMGRYAIAKKDISVGETVIEEEPYAACLKHSSYGTHCNNCFERLQAPYGCPKCASLAFCSPECRNIAMETYHKYECSYMDLFIGSGMSVLCNVALRMITQNGLKKSLEIYDKYLQPREKLASFDDQDSELDVNEKLNVIYNLCTHTEQRTYEDYLSRALMAFFLFRCLQGADFFEKPSDDKLSSEEVKIVTMLLYHLQMLHFNAHEIEEVQKADFQKTNTFKFKPIAVGIYPIVSLFNHDCHQGISRHYVGKKIVMKALKPVAQGEMIPENYGPTFTKRTKYARQRVLRSRYWFRCECMACTEIWPSLEQMPETMNPTLRCPNYGCHGKLTFQNVKDGSTCSLCEKTFKPDRLEALLREIETDCVSKYKEADELVVERKYEEAIIVFSKALSRFYELAYPPFAKTHQAEQKLKSCFSLAQFFC